MATQTTGGRMRSSAEERENGEQGYSGVTSREGLVGVPVPMARNTTRGMKLGAGSMAKSLSKKLRMSSKGSGASASLSKKASYSENSMASSIATSTLEQYVPPRTVGGVGGAASASVASAASSKQPSLSQPYYAGQRTRSSNTTNTLGTEKVSNANANANANSNAVPPASTGTSHGLAKSFAMQHHKQQQQHQSARLPPPSAREATRTQANSHHQQYSTNGNGHGNGNANSTAHNEQQQSSAQHVRIAGMEAASADGANLATDGMAGAVGAGVTPTVVSAARKKSILGSTTMSVSTAGEPPSTLGLMLGGVRSPTGQGVGGGMQSQSPRTAAMATPSRQASPGLDTTSASTGVFSNLSPTSTAVGGGLVLAGAAAGVGVGAAAAAASTRPPGGGADAPANAGHQPRNVVMNRLGQPTGAGAGAGAGAPSGGEHDPNNKDRRRPQTVRRYRGFTSSIRQLFAEEQLVCGAISCFGLLLSSRTDHLINEYFQTGAPSGLVLAGGGVVEDAARRTKDLKKTKSRANKFMGMYLFAVVVIVSVSYLFLPAVEVVKVSKDMFGGDDTVVVYEDDKYNQYNYNNGDDAAAAAVDDDDDGYYDDGYWQNDAYNNNNANDDNNANVNDDNANANANDDANRQRQRQRRNMEQDPTTTPTRRAGAILRISDYDVFSLHSSYWSLLENNDRSLVYDMHPSRIQYYNSGGNYDDAGAGYSSGSNNYNYANQASDEDDDGYKKWGPMLRTGLVLSFVALLGCYGRTKRTHTRKLILQNRYRQDMAQADQINVTGKAHEGRYQGACAHTLVGCYPTDPPFPKQRDLDHVDDDDDDAYERRRIMGYDDPTGQDCCQRLFGCFTATCCGSFCRCHCQCLSMCALAQEAREVYSLIQQPYQHRDATAEAVVGGAFTGYQLPYPVHVDYITHEPWAIYAPRITALNRGSSFFARFSAMSKLSKGIWLLFFVAFIIVCVVMISLPHISFGWANALVLLATFLQSFLVLFIVHRIFTKSYLSLDAITKFFCAGFVLAVPTAFILETVLVNVILFIVVAIYEMLNVFGVPAGDFMVSHRNVILIIAELLNAFVVAAATEELCKYYMFRMVDHPDLVFMNSRTLMGDPYATVDSSSVSSANSGGGTATRPASSGRASGATALGALLSGGRTVGAAGGEDTNTIGNTTTSGQTYIASHDGAQGVGGDCDTTITAEYHNAGGLDAPLLPRRTNRQKAAAVAIAMLSVAVGLACAENVIYVYYLGNDAEDEDGEVGGSASEEFLTLVFRSIFPIHALCAAMQSISVIRRFVEQDTVGLTKIGVGRTILPALVLHGCFDAVLMVLSIFMVKVDEDADDDALVVTQERLNFWLNLIAWVLVILITIVGLVWYFWQKGLQRTRLKLMDAQEAIDRGDVLPQETSSSGSDASGTATYQSGTTGTATYTSPSIV